MLTALARESGDGAGGLYILAPRFSVVLCYDLLALYSRRIESKVGSRTITRI